MADLITPGEVKVDLQQRDGPNAHPHTMQAELPGKIMVMMMGGYTKVEESAIRIAAVLASDLKDFDDLAEGDYRRIAIVANNVAEITLDEARRRRVALELKRKEQSKEAARRSPIVEG